MTIIWTWHATSRQKEWQEKLGITREEVEDLLTSPGQVAPGDAGVLVAQGKRSGGLLRVPFVEVAEGRRILTVYWTSKAARYWREE